MCVCMYIYIYIYIITHELTQDFNLVPGSLVQVPVLEKRLAEVEALPQGHPALCRSQKMEGFGWQASNKCFLRWSDAIKGNPKTDNQQIKTDENTQRKKTQI